MLSILDEGVLQVTLALNNYTYRKEVGLRVTSNGWRSHHEFQASHLFTTPENIDVFTMTALMPELISLDVFLSEKLEFVAYVAYDGQERRWSTNLEGEKNNFEVSNAKPCITINPSMTKPF